MSFAYAPSIHRWYASNQWDEHICAELRPIIAWLSQNDIHIIGLGEYNVKAPEPVFFVNKPLPYREIIKRFSGSIPDLIARDGFVGCNAHWACVVFEGDPIERN